MNSSITQSTKCAKEAVEITIEKGITHIPDSLFLNNQYLIKVTLPEGLKCIGNSAYQKKYVFKDIYC